MVKMVAEKQSDISKRRSVAIFTVDIIDMNHWTTFDVCVYVCVPWSK